MRKDKKSRGTHRLFPNYFSGVSGASCAFYGGKESILCDKAFSFHKSSRQCYMPAASIMGPLGSKASGDATKIMGLNKGCAFVCKQ